MEEIIKEVKENNYSELIIFMLYVTYFIGYIIGYTKRKVKEVFIK